MKRTDQEMYSERCIKCYVPLQKIQRPPFNLRFCELVTCNLEGKSPKLPRTKFKHFRIRLSAQFSRHAKFFKHKDFFVFFSALQHWNHQSRISGNHFKFFEKAHVINKGVLHKNLYTSDKSRQQ